jgi:glycosyltransferase involved in cell wall biosynthesis
MIKDNGLDSRIIFLGKRIDEEKWKLVIKNQIMIHLSSFDGQPLTIIETMSLGIPTIATKVGAIPEMINDGQNGFLIDTNQDVMVIIKNLVGEKIDLSTLSKSTEDSYNNYYTQEIMVNNIKLMLEK